MTTTNRKPAEASGRPTRTDGIGEGQIAKPEPPREATRAIKRVIILPWPSPALSPNSRTHWRARALQDAADKGRIPQDYPMLAIYREQVEAPSIGGPASVASLLPKRKNDENLAR